MTINYLNLSNGIKYIKKFNNIRFIRIQSTLLEAKKFDKVIYELDYNFLYDIATGEDILVIDSSSKKENSRAIFQGIPWIEYVLNKNWLNKQIIPYVRSNNVSTYFNTLYNSLSKCTLKKLKYFRRIINPDTKIIKINTLSFKYEKDIIDDEFKKYIYCNKGIINDTKRKV